MSYQVALSFEDGVTRFITCAAEQTVADASYRSRINIPLDCRDGACGTCKAFCESGEYDGGNYIADALSADEAANGYVLPCSMKPRSDLVLQIASTSAVAKTQAATYTGTLTELRRLSSTTAAFTIETPDRDQLAFLPGQYVNIGVPGTEHSRSYSFSSAPDENRLTFLVKLTPGGVMSDYLSERAAVGDEISFTGPNGSFFLRETERPVLLIAGGTGLAPILSILRKLRTDGTTRPIHLVYGASTDADVVELDAIRDLADDIETLSWDYCVSDPRSAAPNNGYVMSLIRPEHLHDGDVAVYLCGPPPMVESVRQHFAAEGVQPSGFYYEKFALSSAAVAAERPAPVATTAPEPPAPVIAVAPATVKPTPAPLTPVPAPTESMPPRAEDVDIARSISGQRIARPGSVGPVIPLDAESGLIESPDARSIATQRVMPVRADIAPLVPAATIGAGSAVATTGAGGYVIGEEHPSVHQSDAIFEARQALEIGALELTIGRLTSQQLTGYRLLAEATLPYVEGDRFIDAAAYTETNAAFHDYLFMLTGNEHLLQAYQALGVKGHMEEALRNATWCHPKCAQDHLDIVAAFAASDRQAARTLIVEHAERSKQTMRRAMDDARARLVPAFISPGRFDGKVVIVTGAAQGIGERTARRISAEGGSVLLADRSEIVHELAEELSSAARPAHAVIADLETWQGASDVVTQALARFGRIDVAIHTVGGTIWAKPFEHYSPEQIQAEIDRSLFPTLWSCRAVVGHMIERGQGTIVNVSSVATRGLNRVPYAAAKGGVNAITSSLALELAPHGIRVVATAPGGTDAPPRRIPRGPAAHSEQESQWYQTIVEQTVDSSLLKRYGSLDEQAAAITFLASDEASYITGTILPVAGGDLG
jgi:benzoate/toluate 1,2-dioxygenase reductase subunit